MNAEVRAASRTALVVGLASRLKDVAWAPEAITPVVYDHLSALAASAGGKAFATFVLGASGNPSMMGDLFQLTALQRLGADGLDKVVREAWAMANEADAPTGPGFQSFKIEVLLQMLQGMLP